MSIEKIHNKALYLFSKKVLNEIYNMHYAIVKGGCLSNLCFNNPNERFSNDIDILLSKHVLKKADMQQCIHRKLSPHFLSNSSLHHRALFFLHKNHSGR